MIEDLCFEDTSLGMLARVQRVFRRQTREEMANLAGVYLKDVESFESNQRLRPMTKLKLLRAYDLIVEANNHNKTANWPLKSPPDIFSKTRLLNKHRVCRTLQAIPHQLL